MIDHLASPIAEATVLGCILNDPRLMEVAATVLRQDHFTVGSHRVIWNAMLALAANGSPIDVTLLATYLAERTDGKQTDLEAVGGLRIFGDLETTGFSPRTQFETSVQTITERAARRSLRVALEQGAAALRDGLDTSDVVSGLNTHVASLETAHINDDDANASTIAKRVFADMEAGEVELTTCATGIERIDTLLQGGFVPGMHYIVGALSGHGKTTFASAIVAGLLRENPDLAVDWYGCEVPAKWQFCRIASSWGDVSERFWRSPSGPNVSRDLYARAVEALGWGIGLESRLRVFHMSGEIDMRDVALRTAVRRRNLGERTLVVVVDYIQRSAAGQSKEPSNRIAEASRVLAGLADDNTITLALSQFTDAPSASEPLPIPKPTMARWAKDIHHDACDWLTYHRPLMERLPPLAVVQLAKSRYGSLAHVNLVGTPSNRFEPLASPTLKTIERCRALYGVDIASHPMPAITGLNTVELR